MPGHGTTLLAAGTFGPLEGAGPLLVWVVTLTLVVTECAFLVGLFLPGDSLLLTAGVALAAQGGPHQAWALAAAATVAAVVGNQVGYRVGRCSGARVTAREGGRVLNRENLLRASAVMARFGFWGVLAARWIPWVRTLAPMLAGAAHYDQRRFTLASVLGALLWVPTLVLAGYYGAGFLDRLGPVVPFLLGGLVVLLVVGSVVGLRHYRQELRRPVDEAAVARVGAELVELAEEHDARHGGSTAA